MVLLLLQPYLISFCSPWITTVVRPVRASCGLLWPNPPLRPNLGGSLLPETTPPPTSWSLTPSPAILATAASSSAPDPTGPTPYTSDPSEHGAPPFPAMDTSCENRSHHAFFTKQTVHQVFFKVSTYENQRKELWINEINFKGFLTGDDAYARHTADYWRAFFNIPTLHFENPHHYGHRHYNLHPTAPDRPSTTPTSTPTSSTPNIATLAAQHQERLFAPPTPGANPTIIICNLTRTLTPDQLQGLAEGLQALVSSIPSEQTEPPATGASGRI